MLLASLKMNGKCYCSTANYPAFLLEADESTPSKARIIANSEALLALATVSLGLRAHHAIFTSEEKEELKDILNELGSHVSDFFFKVNIPNSRISANFSNIIENLDYSLTQRQAIVRSQITYERYCEYWSDLEHMKYLLENSYFLNESASKKASWVFSLFIYQYLVYFKEEPLLSELFYEEC